MIRITLLSLLVIFIGCGLAIADSSGSVPAAKFIDDNAKKVISILDIYSTSPQQEQAALSKLLTDLLDYKWMAKYTLGRNWNTISKMDQDKFIQTYKDYLISLYVPKYKEYNRHKYAIIDSRFLGNGEYQVTMFITPQDSQNEFSVKYRLKSNSNTFKIIDISTEEVSLITTQRSEFSSFLANNNINDLINALVAKSK